MNGLESKRSRGKEVPEFLSKIDAPYLYSENEQFKMEYWVKPDLLKRPISDGWIGKTTTFPHLTIYVEKLNVAFWKKSFKAHVVQINGDVEVESYWFLPKNVVPISQAVLAIEQYEYWKNTKLCKTIEECDHFGSRKNSSIDRVPVCTQCGKVL
ncbi:hypothetical protein [Acinetobacter pittii]|uniref:hypothetical protein n=1 Tax=Acinetobacter pittii TaxID=48296 RepID=UPI00192B3846|nr:hypothetical protein [Acinetobacter pittii]